MTYFPSSSSICVDTGPGNCVVEGIVVDIIGTRGVPIMTVRGRSSGRKGGRASLSSPLLIADVVG